MPIQSEHPTFRAAIRRAMAKFTPLPFMSLADWSIRYARLPREETIQHGAFSFNGFEYQREPMEAVSDPKIQKVVLMWASQMGKTRIQFNSIGFFSHYDPSPMLMIFPTVHDGEKVSRTRIAKFIAETPVLRELFPDPKARDSENTILQKQFPGGQLIIVGANSPGGLASFPMRVLLPDEVDRYDDSAGEEGDPIDIAEKRLSKYYNRKIIMASSPGIEQLSRIEPEFRNSDQRYYYVPCPHCGHSQVLRWANLHWPSPSNGEKTHRPAENWYECENGCTILEQHKYAMVRGGEWRATATSLDGKTAGFHLNVLYAHEPTWEQVISEWVRAQGNPRSQQVFVNTRLAETWKIRGDSADMSELQKRAQDYPQAENGEMLVPAGVLVLTAGVDVQKDRFEMSVYGWGLNEQSWLVDHRVLRGDPTTKKLQRELLDAINQEYWHELGINLRVAIALVDSGGRYTQETYDFTQANELRRVHSCKGLSGIGRPMVEPATRVGTRKKTLLYGVGVDSVKDTIYSRLRVTDAGTPGYVHFPKAAFADTEFFRQLASEQLVEERKNGKVKLVWMKKPGDRNEALDCAVYAFAAREVLNPALKVIASRMQKQAEKAKEQGHEPSNPAEPPRELPAPRPPGTRPRLKVTGSSFVTGKRY